MPSMQLRRDDVIVGVDTHKDNHVAVAIDGFGGRLGDIVVPTTIAEEGQSLEEYFLAVIGSGPRAQETARRGARTATTRSEPREEETRVQSAAR